MTVYAFIPARGGSVRVPRKNLQEVGDLSLLARAVDCARWADDAPPYQIIVSTDDDEIADRAFEMNPADERHDITVHRRPDVADPNTAEIEPFILDWMERARVHDDDIIVLLQPTSPFRRPETVRKCVGAIRYGLDCGTRDSAATVTLAHSANWSVFDHPREEAGVDGPYLYLSDEEMSPFSPLWKADGYVDGCVYCVSAEALRRGGDRFGRGDCRGIPITRWESFEIDTPEDLEVARLIAPWVEARQ